MNSNLVGCQPGVIVVNKLSRKKVTKCVSQEYYKPTNFTEALRLPYWNVSKSVPLPVSDSKKASLLQKLKKVVSSGQSSPNVKRLYRKLLVNRRREYLKNLSAPPSKAEAGILSTPNSYKHEFIKCSFTNRVLPPVIYQDFDVEPPIVKLHSEIKQCVAKKFPHLKIPKTKKYPINYLYVEKDHIQVINALARQHFWPGIDTSTALKYPEFSCVAAYRKIIVGFGFIMPGNHLSEAYINFIFVRPKWRNCGIGKTILYHLVQSCKAWDITLHVSPTNPALALYQKFGFKSIMLLRNFYESYINDDSKESTHSFFMKLDQNLNSVK